MCGRTEVSFGEVIFIGAFPGVPWLAVWFPAPISVSLSLVISEEGRILVFLTVVTEQAMFGFTSWFAYWWFQALIKSSSEESPDEHHLVHFSGPRAPQLGPGSPGCRLMST